ncbi:MAG TPA: UvrD-helicase domain-containing protein [Gemmatimonadaceae bacterium]|nr:UvrD-helicase domain-containing protein [Gemmatimonadaceae bacterium]
MLEPLAGLNPAQRDAVLHGEGPLLVLAGAGSGKTRVLTTRIFNLIREHGVEPSQILAVTFTNKAAGEMRARLARLLGGEPTGMWVGTFHAIGARLLRANAKYVNRTSAFTIYDEDDIVGTVKRLMDAKGLSVRDLPPKVVHSVISDAKNALVLPSEYAKLASDPLSRAAAQVYNDLERTMQQQNAVDFDDLLLLPVELFRAHPDRLQRYSTMFRYILVDEYQDTNRAQYTLIKLLGSHGNVAVVGDDDQCLVRGTMIAMAEGPDRPIEAVRPGDLVRSGYGSGTFRPARVAAVHERSGVRDGVAIVTARGRRIVSTPEHVHFAGYVLGVVPQTHFTYLMHRRGKGYRIGTTQVYTRGQARPVVGLQQRLHQEHGDALWVISTHASENAAREDEYLVSLRYGLPMLPFVARRTSSGGLVHDQAAIDRIFTAVDTRDGALRLLADRGLAVDQPHLRPRSRNANRRNVVVTLCGDRRGASPMHRISMVGNDGEGRDALAAMGLSVRPAKAGSASWRHETANAQYDVLFDTVERIRERFDVNLFRVARLGSASLPFTPAGSVMAGMAMFTGDGDYDIVANVERVTITEPVYDLDIDKTHNYIANGIVTHNSIYGWRGADIRNILDFEKDFPAARVVRLEENYRSTQPILDLANVVIEGNTQRLGKTLRTNRRGGERVVLVRAADERDEASFVVDQIVKRRLADRQLALKDFAILYRANAQSRAFEEALRRERTPYRVIGAVRFYDRREVRDVMSYLKLIANPADEEAFRRAITVPRRGVGEQALGLLSEAARGAGVSMLEAAGRPDLVAALRPGPRAALAEFAVLLGTLREKAVDAGVDELLDAIVSSISYGDVIKSEPDAAERLENLRELIESAAETVIADGGEVGLRPLDHFLQRTSLVAAIDHLDPNADAVSMMTMHNAKGLEFPIVFITGLEDGLFPLRRAIDSPYTKELEEERRLFYVGITRAERTLYLTYADHRRWNGSIMEGIPSRFLKGIPKEMLEQHQTEAARSFGRSAFATFGQRDDRDPESYRPSLRRPGNPVSLARHGPTRFADEAEVSQDAPAYRVGERVKHKTFGSGVIAEMSGSGKELKVRVDFDNPDIGRKTLVAAQAGLERGWE